MQMVRMQFFQEKNQIKLLQFEFRKGEEDEFDPQTYRRKPNSKLVGPMVVFLASCFNFYAAGLFFFSNLVFFFFFLFLSAGLVSRWLEQTCISTKDGNEDNFLGRHLKQKGEDNCSTQEMSTKVTEIVTTSAAEGNLETETL